MPYAQPPPGRQFPRLVLYAAIHLAQRPGRYLALPALTAQRATRSSATSWDFSEMASPAISAHSRRLAEADESAEAADTRSFHTSAVRHHAWPINTSA